MKRPKKILFTEEELKRRQRKDRLVSGVSNFGKKMYGSAKKRIDTERKLRQEEKKIYDEAYRKEKLRQIRMKATRMAKPHKKKGWFEL